MNWPNGRPVEMDGEQQGRGCAEGSETWHLCLWMEEGVWKRFGLNWWDIGWGRAAERCDGGGHHCFHAFFEMAFSTISKATEHLGRTWQYRGHPYVFPESPKLRYYTRDLLLKRSLVGEGGRSGGAADGPNLRERFFVGGNSQSKGIQSRSILKDSPFGHK
jgi:hypothetical protein